MEIEAGRALLRNRRRVAISGLALLAGAVVVMVQLDLGDDGSLGALGVGAILVFGFVMLHRFSICPACGFVFYDGTGWFASLFLDCRCRCGLPLYGDASAYTEASPEAVMAGRKVMALEVLEATISEVGEDGAEAADILDDAGSLPEGRVHEQSET